MSLLYDGLEVGEVAPPVHAPDQRTAQFTERPCELVKYHAPTPVMSEFHHSKPVFLQNRLYGRIVHGPDLWLCSNCHDSVHAWLYWLLGMWREPTYIGRAAKAEAERTMEWYLSEKARIEGEAAT